MKAYGYGYGLPFAKRRGGLSATLKAKLLFWGKYSDIADNKMPNLVGDDWLTIAGSVGSETYQCPNTLAYKNADADEIWRNGYYALRTPTTAELIGYDFLRTLVKYDDSSPYQIRDIAILKQGETLTDDELIAIYRYFRLSIYWDGTPNEYGYLKGNRGLSRSVFTPDANIIKDDTFTCAWYDPTSYNGRSHDSGVESIYWDKMITYGALGDVITSGNAIPLAVYKIITCQTNYFYTGCQVGDMWICNNPLLLSANNSLQRYTGNHLVMTVADYRPTNQVFSVGDFMKCPSFECNQPYFVYIVFRQLNHTHGKYVMDGGTTGACRIRQINPSPCLYVDSGAAIPANIPTDVQLNTFVILRIFMSGDNSKVIVNEGTPITGNFGTNALGGFTLNNRGGGGSYSTSIEFKEAIIRSSDTGESTILTYLKTKYSL